MTSSPAITGWRVSTWCTRDDHDNCVEIGNGHGAIGIRDTKERGNPDQQALVVDESAFSALLRHVV